jgi:hypothetical protein
MMNGTGASGKRGFKLQVPTSKLQRNSNDQPPNSLIAQPGLAIGGDGMDDWNLEFLWSLVLGIWSF